MKSDGTQYDIISAPWSADELYAKIEEALASIASAETDQQRMHFRAIAESYNNDLRTLHGIDFL